MIKIDDEFSIDNDKYNWMLVQTYDYYSTKSKNTETSTRTTYYATLKALCAAALDKGCKREENLKNIIARIEGADAMFQKLQKEFREMK